MTNLLISQDLCVSLAHDLGSTLKPFDVRVLMSLLPDLVALNGTPLRINQARLAVALSRKTPQVARSIANLKKAGYIQQHNRDGISYTYTLNPELMPIVTKKEEFATTQTFVHLDPTRIYGDLPKTAGVE